MEIYRKVYLAAFVSVALLAIPVVSVFANAETIQPITVSTESGDKKILFSQADDYAKAFAAGDYKTIANMWTPDGTFVDINGRTLCGRAAIESYFKTNFERVGGQSLELAIDSIRFPSDNIAIEEGHSRLLDGPAIDIVSRYSVVHVKQNNKWQMYAVTETTFPGAVSGSLEDWDWLIGNWSAKPSSKKNMHITASWAVGRKFIRCLFEIQNTGSGMEMAMLVIGRDPNSGQIISWHFDPSGGYGSGKWIKDGQTWIERANSVESDGATGSALYTLHKVDNNTFTWRSSQRYLNATRLPDYDAITVTRESTGNK